ELARGMEIKVGRGLAAADMLAAAVNVTAKGVGEAEMSEMAGEPPGRARRSNGPRQLGRKRAHEIDRSDHRAHAFAKRADALLLAAFVEFWREGTADPLLDRGDELRPAKAD